jgi:hypothetical protein
MHDQFVKVVLSLKSITFREEDHSKPIETGYGQFCVLNSPFSSSL